MLDPAGKWAESLIMPAQISLASFLVSIKKSTLSRMLVSCTASLLKKAKELLLGSPLQSETVSDEGLFVQMPSHRGTVIREKMHAGIPEDI